MFIEDSIRSVLKNTYSDYEIIIVDDGSTDNTKYIIQKYLKKFTNIKYVYQTNKGVASARNRGILEAKGSFIAFLDADDIWLPEKIKHQLEFLKKNPDAGLVHCDIEYFNNSGSINHRIPIQRSYIPEGNCFKELFMGRFSRLLPSAVMIPRNCLDKVGYLDESFKGSDDYDLFLRLARRYKFGYIDKILVRYRKHENNLSKQISMMYEDELKVVKKILSIYPEISNEIGNSLVKKRLYELNFRFGYHLFSSNKYKDARYFLKQAIMGSPTMLKPYFYILSSFLPNKLITVLRNYKSNMNNKKSDKNILFTNEHAEIGGGEIALLEHIKRIKLKGFNIFTFLLSDGKFKKVLRETGVKVFDMQWRNNNRLQRLLSAICGFCKMLFIIKSQKISLVISYTFNDLLLSGVVTKITKIPLVWRSQGEIVPYLATKQLWFKKLTLGFINKIVTYVFTTTRYDKKRLIDTGIDEDKISVISLGVDPSKYSSVINRVKIREEFNIPNNIPLIGIIGRLVPQKGQDIFLKALVLVKHKIPNIRALIVGDDVLTYSADYKQTLFKLTKQLGLEDTVIFTGFRNDTPAILNSIDIFVHTSLKEPFGMVIIEAMVAGKPVIASNTEGPREIIKDKETGILVESGNYQALADAIIHSLNNKDEADSMASKAKEYVQKFFDLDKNISKINEHCETLISK